MPNSRLFSHLALSVCAFVACNAVTVGHADEPLKVIPLLGEPLDFDFGAADGEPEITVSLTPSNAKPGDEVTLSVHVDLPPNSYTYSTSPTFLGRTQIQVEQTVGLEPLGDDFVSVQKPKREFVEVFEQEIEKHFKQVTWKRIFRIRADADLSRVAVIGTIQLQVCNDRRCLPIKQNINVALQSDAADPGHEVSTPPASFIHEETPEFRGQPGPATVRIEISPTDANPGDRVTLAVSITVKEGWHTYSITQIKGPGGLPTTIDLNKLKGLVPTDGNWKANAKPEEKTSEFGDGESILELHHGTIRWTREFRVAADAKSYGVGGRVQYMTCDAHKCLPPKRVAFELGDLQGATLITVSQPTTNVPESPTEITQDDNKSAVTNEFGKKGLIPFLITAFIAGFAALLTPCVFPMIPITVSFFLKQSEKEHHRPVTMASAYCFGIVATFTGLGLLMSVLFKATAMQQLANQPWLNLGIAGVLIFFGLNLLGLFEIRLPSGLLTWSSGRQGQGGLIGVLFMALTFTLVSFTCTFAFAGGLLVLAAKGEYFWPILGMLAFSAAFSLPFFFLALFPSFLQKLPKSGGWMNRVKVTMGIVEIAAAAKFLNIADQMWNPVPLIFNFPVVMSAWIVLALVAGLYLFGVFRMPHDSPTEGRSVTRLMFAVVFFGLAGYLAVGLYAPGKMWDQIAAFAPPQFEGGKGDIGPFLEHDGLTYALSYDHALQFAQKKNDKPLFLDFTGVNCVNCRLMERRMKQPRNRKELEKFVRVQLYTDSVPYMKDRQLAEKLKENNLRLQEDWFGDVSLPAYAVVTPDGKTVLATFKGLEQTEGEFADFLAAGHAKWRQLASSRKNDRTSNAAPRTGLTAIR